jgi:hypothetical protein
MRISLKILAYLWIILFVIIGGLLFNAYSKLKPEAIITLLTNQVQKNYPGSKLSVGQVSYGFSLDFNLNLQEVDLRRDSKIIARIKELELKVPWWLLLTNKGNAQINLTDLDFYVDHGEDLPFKEKKQPSKPKTLKFELPSYLSEAKYTFRAFNISVRDIQSSRRYFNISKLLVREFQYGKNSAFELNIPISIKRKDSRFTSELWLFGDMTPQRDLWKMNFRGEFKTKESNEKYQIEDLVIGGKAMFSPTEAKITSDVELSVEKNSAGEGKFSLDENELDFSLEIKKLPLNYFSFIYEEINNPYLVNPDGNAIGSVKLHKNYETSQTKISGKLNFDGKLFLSEQHSIPGKWKISFVDFRWEVSFMSPKGEASFFRRSVVDPQKSIVSQYIEELGFSGLDLSVTAAPIASLPNFIQKTPSTYFTTNVSYKKCLLKDQTLDGNFKYGFTPEQKFYQGEIFDDKSSLKISYSDRSPAHALDMVLTNFKWDSSYQFLLPIFNVNSGVLDGKIEGRWPTDWDKGLWSIQIKGSQLVEANGKIIDFINTTSSLFQLEAKNYNKKVLNASVKNGVLNLSPLSLGLSEKIRITGQLNSNAKSFLNLISPKNPNGLKKEVLENYWLVKDGQ